ncbi:MAG: hypothetical protein IJ772_02870 [Bacilli bacterium]|nr:hypothetical protein [Bacilli bacterium]
MMKKILKSLILLILICPLFVKADMGAPQVRQYEIVVIKEGGIDYYQDPDYQKVAGHLNKEETAKVVMEYNDITNIEIENKYYYIKREGVIAKESEVTPSSSGVKKQVKIKSAIVNNKNGVEVKKGPASMYEIIGTIPYNTELTWQYYIDNEGMTDIYIEKDGLKGWVNILQAQVLIENDNTYLITSDINTECGIIPANKALRATYKTDMWSGKTFFNYKNCTIEKETRGTEIAFIPEQLPTNKTFVDTTIYENKDFSGKVIATIPKNEEFIEIAYVSDREYRYATLFIKYQEYYGWIKVGEEGFDSTDKRVSSEEVIKELILEEKEEETIKETPVQEEKKEEPNTKDTIIMAVIAGFGLAIASLGLIILVNNKKKK